LHQAAGLGYLDVGAEIISVIIASMRGVARELIALIRSGATFERGGGLAALLAGVLFAAWGYIDSDDISSYLVPVEVVLRYSVPLLFLVGLAGLQARCWGRVGWLGEIGFVLGFIAAVRGVVDPYSNMVANFFYPYFIERGWPTLPLDWVFWLFAGLTLIGLDAVSTKALRGYGAVLLAMASCSWVYIFTDSAHILEARLLHNVFGTLFSLSWVVLGCKLLSEKAE